ncbi:hypothetical protein MYXO_03552 [Myxococcaceae bacterium]|nr:hypothetical protein MYXO_03552 [Myxococcaceae bacterium]
MSTAVSERLRLPGVRPPKPLLAPAAEQRLTERQREILDSLEALVVRGGLADRTMAEIAARVNCSLRTLYGIAPSKDELVLAVVDRRLHRIGRSAIEALDPHLPPLESLRRYLSAVSEAVQPVTAECIRDFASVPGARRIFEGHERYVIAVAKSLLDRAVREDVIAPVDTAAVAHVLGSLGREFSRPELASLIARPAKETADAISELILRGLAR